MVERPLFQLWMNGSAPGYFFCSRAVGIHFANRQIQDPAPTAQITDIVTKTAKSAWGGGIFERSTMKPVAPIIRIAPATRSQGPHGILFNVRSRRKRLSKTAKTARDATVNRPQKYQEGKTTIRSAAMAAAHSRNKNERFIRGEASTSRPLAQPKEKPRGWCRAATPLGQSGSRRSRHRSFASSASFLVLRCRSRSGIFSIRRSVAAARFGSGQIFCWR